MALNIIRTGSAWTKAAAHAAGQADDSKCILCGDEETFDHFWRCKTMEKHRFEADEQIAKIKVEELPPALRIGVAPALNADPMKTFWGGELGEDQEEAVKKLCGCREETKLGAVMRDLRKLFNPDTTAREVMRLTLPEQALDDLPCPQWDDAQTAPDTPNVYTDGSLKSGGQGQHWQTGGVGVFWEKRSEASMPTTEDEKRFMHVEKDDSGWRGYAPFNGLQNSSTRCEIAVAMLSLLPKTNNGTCIAIDNQGAANGK